MCFARGLRNRAATGIDYTSQRIGKRWIGKYVLFNQHGNCAVQLPT
jgi:hypothetical protein